MVRKNDTYKAPYIRDLQKYSKRFTIKIFMGVDF